jgi:hypothetical protein
MNNGIQLDHNTLKGLMNSESNTQILNGNSKSVHNGLNASYSDKKSPRNNPKL